MNNNIIQIETTQYGDYVCPHCRKQMIGKVVSVAEELDEDIVFGRSFHPTCFKEVNKNATLEQIYNEYETNDLHYSYTQF